MGLDQRDYMDGGGREPSLGGRWAVMALSHKLIVLNAVVFVLWQVPSLEPLLAAHFTVSWGGVFERGYVHTLLTAAFSHYGLWHILWNMLFLHWFGPDLERVYGRRNFLFLYLSAALVSSLAHAVYSHLFGADVPAFGASGAVMAVVFVMAMLFPQRRILFMFVIPMPLWLLAALKLGGDLLGVAGGGSGVAHAAHIGGALAGVAFKLVDLRPFASPGEPAGRAPLQGLLGRLRRRVGRRRAGRIVRFEPREETPAERPGVDAGTSARVDDLLRKINREGIAALSAEERQFLEQASSRYRRP